MGLTVLDLAKQIAAAKPRKKRDRSRPKTSSVEDFIKSSSFDTATQNLLLVAAALWYELKLAIDSSEGARAIQYCERVDVSRTNMGIVNWMAQNSDKRAAARNYRKFTASRARALLDRHVVMGETVQQLAVAEFERPDPTGQQKSEIRARIRDNLEGFAALTRLPGA